jgi:uncharacterized protein (DUF2336 family)
MTDNMGYALEMVTFLKRLFGQKPASPAKAQRDLARYAKEREAASGSAVKDRIALAKSGKTHPEILYYLAEHDGDPKVRKAVAKNALLPLQAATVLARDPDQDVRLILASRLCQLLPQVTETEHAQLFSYLTQALGTLALDEVLKVRVALSSALKDAANAPPQVVGQLARDIERSVSEPILRSCIALTDADILEILASHPAPWVPQAIASRKTVSASVSQAVIEIADEAAGRTLISNKGSYLTPSVLQAIVDRAKSFPSWHKPLVLRNTLPSSIALELASFIDMSVRDLLLAREDFDVETIDEIASVVQRRLAFMDATDDKPDAKSKFKALLVKDALHEAALMDSLAVREKDLAKLILSHLADTTLEQVEKIFAMRAPKAIIALCWKADLSMRTALAVQRDLAGLPPQDVLLPRGGTDYPLSKADLKWQIDFLGL